MNEMQEEGRVSPATLVAAVRKNTSQLEARLLKQHLQLAIWSANSFNHYLPHRCKCSKAPAQLAPNFREGQSLKSVKISNLALQVVKNKRGTHSSASSDSDTFEKDGIDEDKSEIDSSDDESDTSGCDNQLVAVTSSKRAYQDDGEQVVKVCFVLQVEFAR